MKLKNCKTQNNNCHGRKGVVALAAADAQQDVV